MEGHGDQIAARIVQLGGEPNFSPEGLLTRSHAEYVEGEDLVDMIEEDLVAERIAIDSYGEMMRYLGNDDPALAGCPRAFSRWKRSTPKTSRPSSRRWERSRRAGAGPDGG
jgi:hypothetical protein